MDFRIALVLGPLAVAAGWAGFNIFRAALQQVQLFMDKEG
nr:photosystem II protein Y [Romeriopsis navalis]